MTIQHKNIPEADLHEPKGISTAASGKVYVSNGLGSGAWTTRSSYGELYITSGAATQALTTTAAKLNPGSWANGEMLGITLSSVNGTMAVTETSRYFLHFWVSFNTDSVAAGTLYTFYYNIDGVTAPRSFSVQKLTAGVDRLDAGAFGIASLTAGQVVSIYAKSSTNSTITPVEAGFSIDIV